ncbi:calmodulin calcium-dependent NAD kinase isoform X1 [Cannabis sativa]|uniref:Zeta toxin domain-containing protein n=2 Tax=Cannabis sativa TaxID=3483 RepID=A0A803Q0Y9_CANSA|nr:calmodulin calcium-dependent NAD kinase isoform X1 [Cannabis sativa]
MSQLDGKGKVVQILAASFFGYAAARVAAARFSRPKLSEQPPLLVDQHLIPRLERTQSGRVQQLEKFSHFVARQLGFENTNECEELCRLAMEYLRKPKGCEQSIYEYFGKEEEVDSLYVMLLEEFERCILSYFAFHWSQASLIISQCYSVESGTKTKLKGFVLAATRKQRFERVTRDLKVTRLFSTLVEEMKAIGGSPRNKDGQCTDIMVPAALSERSPVLLLMGGGMGAGKSTVLKDILKDSFWSEAGSNAVVVEADAFKETDVIYRALNSMGHHNDLLQTAELVHQSSTDAASSLLVTALNEGRDVIMDGTLSWEPFVKQTVAMARNVHKFRYRMGVGYKVAEDGTINENYWEQITANDIINGENNDSLVPKRKPYRIELVGVVCDPYLAVVRGIRRAIMIGRAVRVNSQLTSHKRFATAFPRYCHLVDNARLYCTDSMGGPPKLIGWKEGEQKLLVDSEEIECLNTIRSLNSNADSIHELYADSTTIFRPGFIWNDIVLSPSRSSIQKRLRESIQKIENSNINTS